MDEYGTKTQTYTAQPSYRSNMGDVAATMYGQAPSVNLANMLAASGYANRFGGQMPSMPDLSNAYQALMDRQASAYQPNTVTVDTTPTSPFAGIGGK